MTTYTADTVICFNDPTSTIQLATTGGYAPYLYSYNNGNFTSQTTYTGFTQGSFPFVVMDSNHCKQNIQVVVPGPASPLSVLIDKNDVPCFETNTGSVKLTLSGGWPPYQYTWSDGGSGLERTQIGETHVSFSVTDDQGCVVNQAIDVDQLLCCKAVVPNAFSPNGDQKNDVLKVIPISAVQSIKFSIFDRWGKNIYTTKTLGDTWDGKYNGVDCEMDVYFYYLEYTCPFQKEKVNQKGDITLIR